MMQASSSATEDFWLEPDGPHGPGGRAKPNWTDLFYLVMLALGAWYGFERGGHLMDVYDKAILVGAVPVLAWLGWLWRPLRPLTLGLAVATVLALWLYNGNLEQAEASFWLRYML